MILIFADAAEGHLKKSSYEALSYGGALAGQMGTSAEAVVLGKIEDKDSLKGLGKFGISKVYHDGNAAFDQFDSKSFASALAALAREAGAQVIVFSHNSSGKAIAPRLSAALKAGVVTGAVALPETGNGFTIKKSVFSGKAFAHVAINTDVKIISLNPNAFGIKETGGGDAEIVEKNLAFESGSVKTVGLNLIKGEIPLNEAEIVVSGGRGLKGPENWGLVEDLAEALGAATACSRPVADADWRPHHEHVGQTGGAIAPNLYIAIGISGAIQHLAGVNRSKNIVVINKDPEAPFFKAADYGIVGDAFEVVPKITEAVKKLKGK